MANCNQTNTCCCVDFSIEETNLTFGITNTSINFETELGYITGNNDYRLLSNKPQINSITLLGNKTSEELGLEPTINDITEQDIDNIIYA